MAKVWHYKNEAGVDEICKWALGLEKRQIIKLQAKVDLLIKFGSDLPPQLLADTGQPHIKKLKVKGNVQLRPLLCRTTDPGEDEEYVILVGAKEIQSKYVPPDALAIAAERRTEVLENEDRKTPHIRFLKCNRK